MRPFHVEDVLELLQEYVEVDEVKLGGLHDVSEVLPVAFCHFDHCIHARFLIIFIELNFGKAVTNASDYV